MKGTDEPYKPRQDDSERSTIASVKGRNPYERIKIRDCMKMLNIKDARTFKKWCRQWHVPIYKGIGGRFLLAEEFMNGQLTEISQQRDDTPSFPIPMKLKDERRKTFKDKGNLSGEAMKFNDYLNKKSG